MESNITKIKSQRQNMTQISNDERSNVNDFMSQIGANKIKIQIFSKTKKN